jgi:hypothetical protein
VKPTDPLERNEHISVICMTSEGPGTLSIYLLKSVDHMFRTSAIGNAESLKGFKKGSHQSLSYCGGRYIWKEIE